jgi:hypothetical protein
MVQENNKFWTNLWYTMSDGNIMEYDSLKGKEIGEFWRIYMNWEKKVKKNGKGTV